MSEDIEETDDAPKKASKLPLIIGIVLAVLLGGGGFFAVYTGLLLGPKEETVEIEAEPVSPLADVSFLPLDPMVINVARASKPLYLRFRGELEVEPPYIEDVRKLVPRIMDILNGYLRAVPIAELEDPTALIKLRAQMLRRIQIVVGEGRVHDILIMEFVIN